MFIERAWHFAATSRELGRKPLTRRLLGHRIALFRDSRGTPHALGAVCPHRGADLGRGRVHGDQLACPYHGWRFDAEGVCQLVPALGPDGRVPPLARVARYRVHEQQGIVYAWLARDTEPSEEPTRLDFLDGAHLFPAQRVDGSMLAAVGNALDDAHVAFIHTGSIGGDQDPYVPKLDVSTHEDGRGATAVRKGAEGQPRTPRRGWSRILARMRGNDVEGVAEKSIEYRLPGLVIHRYPYADGSYSGLFAFATPEDASHTWFAGGTFGTHQPDWLGRIFSAFFLRLLTKEDDAIVRQLWELTPHPGGLARPVSVPSDRLCNEFRRLYGKALRAEGRDVPWEETAP